MSLSRWGPVAGIVFVPLLIVGLLLANSAPDTSKDPAAKFVAFYSDAGNRAQVLVGMYVVMLAALSFAIFAASLVVRVRAAGGGTTAMVASVAVLCALLGSAGAAMGWAAGEIASCPCGSGRGARAARQGAAAGMPAAVVYHGLLGVRGAHTQRAEQVWTALVWETAAATAGWSGTLTPEHGGRFQTLAAAQVGLLLSVVLVSAAGTVRGQLVLQRYEEPLLGGGALVRSALLRVAGVGALPSPAAAAPAATSAAH